MADVTRRFRAATSVSYGYALAALIRYARDHDADFSFGPVGNVSVRDNGLVITGPEAVVEVLTDLLDREAPGLTEVEA